MGPIANPLATILSVAMMYRYSLGAGDAADAIEQAVGKVLSAGYRTADIHAGEGELVNTEQMGELVLANL